MSQGTTFAARARAAELNSARAAAAAKEAMTSGPEGMVYYLVIRIHRSAGDASITLEIKVNLTIKYTSRLFEK